jgi:hypothetical protein
MQGMHVWSITAHMHALRCMFVIYVICSYACVCVYLSVIVHGGRVHGMHVCSITAHIHDSCTALFLSIDACLHGCMYVNCVIVGRSRPTSSIRMHGYVCMEAFICICALACG